MKKLIVLLIAFLGVAAPIEANAALQCVTYARDASGINLKGDAWQWWTAANGVYERGRIPRDGGVLVFSRQGSMRHGHVSVVTRVVSNRMVLVNHANWAPSRSAGRGLVAEAVPVIDVSPRNDWSQVRVWYRPANDYGNRVYKTDGFVYRPAGAAVRKASFTAPAPVAVEKPVPTPKAELAAPKAEAAAAAKVDAAAAAKVDAAAAAVVAPAPAPVPAPAPAAVEAKAEQPPAPKAEPASHKGFDPRDWAEQAMSAPSTDGLAILAAHPLKRRTIG